MKIIGVVPARMASSRFPGKPLFPICGRPMVEHVFRRAAMYPEWTGLFLATCDEEIAAFGRANRCPTIMTSSNHTRALDRVAEAASKCGVELSGNDVVVCVQGDEPMMRPDMIETVVAPLKQHADVDATVLGMEIVDEAVFRNPDTVKIVHDIHGDVLYTSRAPIPYCTQLTPGVGARRIYGILAFRWHYLKRFLALTPTPLELLESCDSNRICGTGLKQRVAPYPYIPSFSVDSQADRALVEREIVKDPLWRQY